MEEWLLELAGKAFPLNGSVVLANIDHCTPTLLRPETVSEFLSECIEVDTTPAYKQFLEQCRGNTGRRIGFRFQCPVDRHFIDDEDVYTSVVNTTIFLMHIVSPAYRDDPKGPFAATVLPGEITLEDHRSQWQRVLREFSEQNLDWVKLDATLGQPYNERTSQPHRLCWLSKYSAVQNVLNSTDDDMTSRATAVRNALGLLHLDEGISIMTIRFPARIYRETPGLKVGQPTFIDASDNPRFAAVQPGNRYEANRNEQWGTTIHLSKLEAGAPDLSGLPERISDPVPLTPGDFVPEFLGTIGATEHPKRTDKNFVAWLFAGKPVEAIVKSILANLRGGVR